MKEKTFNFNRNFYRLESFNKFFFKISGDKVPNDFDVITDLNSFWVKRKSDANIKNIVRPERSHLWRSRMGANGDIKICPFCFNTLYLNWKNKLYFEEQISFDDLDIEKIDKSFFALLDSFLKKVTLKKGFWSSFIIKTKKHCFVKHRSYEFCKNCYPRKLITLDKNRKLVKKHLDKCLADFKRKISAGQATDSFSFDKFEKELSSFQLFSSTFQGSGLPKDFLKKYYLSTYLSVQLSSDQTSKLILCGGIDRDSKLSLIKAGMEFVERYALRNLSFSSPIFIDEGLEEFAKKAVNLKDFTNKYSAKFKKYLSSDCFKKYLIAGVDFIEEKSVFLPLQLFFNSKNFLGQYKEEPVPAEPVPSDIKNSISLTSSSGFAAHTSLNEAIENSVLELIERDAFIRWWMAPENCDVLDVGNKVNKEVENITSTFKELLDQDVYIKFLLLPSPLEVPVVFAFLSSATKGGFPAMVVGASANYYLQKAIEKAFLELKVGALNLIARFQKNPNWLEDGVDLKSFENIKDATDHSYFYHHPEVLSSLKFLKNICSKKVLKSEALCAPQNLEQLKVKVEEMGMNWYVVDVTPQKFEKVGVFVIKSFIPQLYMLFFGGFWPFKCPKELKYSVAKKLPHCFP